MVDDDHGQIDTRHHGDEKLDHVRCHHPPQPGQRRVEGHQADQGQDDEPDFEVLLGAGVGPDQRRHDPEGAEPQPGLDEYIDQPAEIEGAETPESGLGPAADA